MWYYESKRDDSEVVKKLDKMAEKLPTRGFDEYYGRIRNEGLKWNRKRVLRVESLSHDAIEPTQEAKKKASGSHKRMATTANRNQSYLVDGLHE
jgi:putative transposase